jgi:hypothetical protein
LKKEVSIPATNTQTEMPRKFRDITNELLCTSETIEKVENNTPMLHRAWAVVVAESSTSKVGNDMMDKNLMPLLKRFPDCDASRVKASLKHHDNNFDRATKSLLDMVNVPPRVQAPASNGMAQMPVFMHPIGSNSPTATLPAQTNQLNVKTKST